MNPTTLEADKALRAIVDNPNRVCGNDPSWDAWTSDDEYQRNYAVSQCLECPLLVECRAWAHENRPTAGVWGGLDFQVDGLDGSGGLVAVSSGPSPTSPTRSGRRNRGRCRWTGEVCVNQAQRSGLCDRHHRQVATGVVSKRYNDRGVVVEVALDAMRCGKTRLEAAEMLGVTARALHRQLARYGRHDVWAALSKVSAS